MTGYTKPLPVIDDSNRAYWDGLREQRVRFQACGACAMLRTYPLRFCPACGSDRMHWAELSGRGKIWSFGIFHQVYFEGFRKDVPYNVAVIQLDEGPRVYSNIVDIANADIRIDMPVEAVFDPVTDEVSLLKFRVALTDAEIAGWAGGPPVA